MTDSQRQELCGWINDPKARDLIAASMPTPCYGDANSAQAGTGKGKDVFLWEIERQLFGNVRDPHAQTIGDCTSQGITGAGEDLLIVQASKGIFKKPEKQIYLASEPVYAGGRIQIGQGACGRGDGAIVGWVVKFVMQYGFLPRGVYGQYDLSTYSGQTARNWGRPGAGCPTELLEPSKHYPVKTASLIEGPDFYEQAIDVIANGGLIVTGSNQLYSNTRDQYGFCTPQGRGGHCTYYRGFTDNPRRPGIAYQQSWDKQIPSGNQSVMLPHGVKVQLPYGCFFIDAENFNRMHRGQEVWAITSEAGWEPAPDDWTIRFA